MRRPVRMPGAAPLPRWRAIQDARGQWSLVDGSGTDPMRSTDPLTRLYAVHLAAAAPELAEALEMITLRVERMPLDLLRADRRLVQRCWWVLAWSRPGTGALALARVDQQEMDLGSGVQRTPRSA